MSEEDQSNMFVCAAPDCEETFEKNSHNQRYHDQQCKRDAENARRRREMVSDIAKAVATTYGFEGEEGEEDDEDQFEFLRKENRRLHNLVLKHKNNDAEVVRATYDAAYAALSSLTLKPISMPKIPSSSSKSEEVANPILSDFQLGKQTESYDSDVCRERIAIYADKVVSLTNIQRADHPVKRAHVYLLGDIVEGESIFPGQSYEIDSSLYRQIVNGVEIVVDYLRQMLSTFETVHVAAVIGNHGRLGRRGDYNPESNMDRMLYKFVSMIFADEPRISFNIPEGDGQSNFYTVDYIGDYGTLLMHGDQFPSPTSFHAYYKKLLGWKDGGITERFDDCFIGHYHQNTKVTLGNTILRISGTPESHNTFAQEIIGVMGRPSQHLQYVSPTRGVTCEYDVYLD